MSDSTVEIVVGETDFDFIAPIQDENGAAINITNYTFLLQGESEDLPGKQINVAGVILDAALGLAKWPGIGDSDTYVSEADLGSKQSALFRLKVRRTSPAGKVRYGKEMLWRWMKDPLT